MLQIPDQKVPLTADSNGVLFVTDTRVSLHSVVGMFEEGASAEKIVHEYDSLSLPDVYAVLTYYLRNRDAVRSKLAAEEVDSEEAARRFENSFPDELRAKLLQGKQGGG
jgi:uncharacterized protein (DUF433 family)